MMNWMDDIAAGCPGDAENFVLRVLELEVFVPVFRFIMLVPKR